MSNTGQTIAKRRPRRTQEERSAETQQRVLAATIECLLEFGYGGTTTHRVAARAGVTRGALLHHFPSRTDLVAAAVRFLAVRRAEEALAEFGRIGEGQHAIEQAIDLLWAVHQGPLFTAAIELLVAARTDPELAAEMRKVEPIVLGTMTTTAATLAPEGVDPQIAIELALTAKDAIQGMLVNCYADADRERAQTRWPRLRRHLLSMMTAELAVPAAAE
ncbi:TetR/AcrR family transcriptional regulator [Nocardia yunnanensis]|uniref:TetR/AcrR family transcriptional regulator n=1 Tax=Nocardia yunnanensis TaxID=2382165 RepID=A0A386ZC53_9NOCA|nr:TetR/AcrR family transcriptional regulator [Nocardia yunnanensis]AYF74887.1 TetR/AcrR family transcriptional regulator [Nocardia yunnanensis]